MKKLNTSLFQKKKKMSLRAEVEKIKSVIYTDIDTESESGLKWKINVLKKSESLQSKLLEMASFLEQHSPIECYQTHAKTKLKNIKSQIVSLDKAIQQYKENNEKIQEEMFYFRFYNQLVKCEEIALKSYSYEFKPFISHSLEEDFNKFQEYEEIDNLIKFLIQNPDCHCLTFCTVVIALFEFDKSLKLFAQELNKIVQENKSHPLIQRLIYFIPETISNQESDLYKFGFKPDNQIIELAEESESISFSGSKTTFVQSGKTVSKINTSLEACINSLKERKPENIFLKYSADRIADALTLISSLSYGMRKLDHYLRNNFEKPVKTSSSFFRIRGIYEFAKQQIFDMVTNKADMNDIHSMLQKISDVLQILKNNCNDYAVLELSFPIKDIEELLRVLHGKTMKQLLDSIKYSFNGSSYSINNATETNLPCSFQDSDQIIKSRSEFKSKQKGNKIPIHEFLNNTFKSLEKIFPYQRPIGPSHVDINIFRELVFIIQYMNMKNFKSINTI